MLKYHEYLLLKKFSNTNSILSMNELSNYLDLTSRATFLTIKNANEWLNIQGFEGIKNLRNHGYYLMPDDIPKIKDRLRDKLLKSQVELPQEMRIVILEFFMLTQKKVTSLLYLSSITGSGISTTKKDINKIREKLKKENLKVDNKFFHIIGNETIIRKLAFKLIEQYQDTTAYERCKPFLQLPTQDFNLITDSLVSLGEKCNLALTDNALKQINAFINISVIRYRNGHPLKQQDIIDKSIKNKLFVRISDVLSKLCLSEKYILNESIMLVNMILSRQITNYKKIKKIDNLYKVTENVITNFKLLIADNTAIDEELKDALYTHLLATKKRVDLKVQFESLNKISIKEQYPGIYLLTKKAIIPFEEMLNEKLTESEIGLIAVYFGGEIERTLKDKKKTENVRNILIVCGSGIGTSRLLQIRLTNLFSDKITSQVITKQEYANLATIPFDIVITTIQIKNKGKPIINISESLSDRDIMKISNYIEKEYNKNTKSDSIKTTQVLDIVSEYAKVLDFTALTEALESYFSNNNSTIKKQLDYAIPNLSELLPEARIKNIKKISKWQETVKIAGELLEADGLIDNEYIKKMQKQIEKYGPYMLIAPNIMLLHAKPIDNEKYNKPGMSLLKLENAVFFNDDVKAKYIFALYSPTTSIHLKALTQMTEMLTDKGKFSQFEEANSPQELTKIFFEMSEMRSEYKCL